VLAQEVEPLTEFFDAIRSPITKDRYEKRLDLFFRGIGIEGIDIKQRAREFVKLAKADNQWATRTINDYMRKQKERAERKEISESTVPQFYKPIKLFCEMNDILLNWKKISKRIPRGRSYGQDRLPTLDEIKLILSYPDRRIKPAALLMLSAGIRVGAFDYLNWGHIERIEKNAQLMAARVKVYAGTPDEYQSFLTPECFHALEEYMKFRQSNGEKVTKDSPVIRDLFHPDKLGKGEPHMPKRLKSSGVKRLFEDALKGTGIRKALEAGKRRHEFQVDHGFRKFFKSVCERQMKSLHVEMLMGHNVGLAENYYRPSEGELVTDYLKAVPELTILEKVKGPSLEKLEELEKDNLALRKEVLEIKEQVKVLGEMMAKRKR
jgi:integrase